MRRRTLIVLVLALSAGGLAGYSALEMLRARTTPAAAAEAPRGAQVVIAARDLAVGTLIGEEDVRVVEWPGNALPAGYATGVPDVVGRGVMTDVRMNEPLLETRLADRAGGGGMPILIPEGMRAVAVRVDEIVAVAGFVTPGTRADVLLTITPTGGGDAITKTVLQNVTVLAAGQQVTRDPEGRPITVGSLTVLVTPEDGEKLIHASAQGRIQLALRNMMDVREIRTTGARVAGLLTGASGPTRGPVQARAVRPSAEEVAPATIEVVKGGVRTLKRF